MKSFFARIGNMFADLFTSKKFVTTAAGVGIAIAQGTPIGTAVLAGAAAYTVGQGMADFGKNKK